MKKSLIIAISALLGLGACDTMTTNLEGKWQLNQIESEGNVATVDTVWYNFQTTLFQYQIYDRSSDSYRYSYGYNFYEGDQLTLQLLSDPRPSEQYTADIIKRRKTIRIQEILMEDERLIGWYIFQFDSR